MSEAERWEWHAEVYAFRRVVLHVPAGETTSPPDPDGRWFDEPLAAAAERRCRARFLDAADRRRL